MPRSSTNDSTLRSVGRCLPSSSLQMNTIVSAYGPLVMNVFEPLSTYSSPSRRAVDFIEPNASEPEPGSVIAHAPILSIVSRSSAQRSFWAIVPFDMIAAEVSPIDTPIAVTMPGHTRHSSMIGISDIPPPPPPSTTCLGTSSPASIARSRSMPFLKRSRAIASMPNVANSLRRMSYGGRSPCSSSSTCGRISSSTNRLTASRIIRCSSLHWNIACPPRVSNRRTDRRDAGDAPNASGSRARELVRNCSDTSSRGGWGGITTLGDMSPSEVVTAFIEAIERKDVAAAAALVSPDDLLREHADAADRRS